MNTINQIINDPNSLASQYIRDFDRSCKNHRIYSCNKYALLLMEELQSAHPILKALEEFPEYVEAPINEYLDLREALLDPTTELNYSENVRAYEKAYAEVRTFQYSERCPKELRYQDFTEILEICKTYREIKDILQEEMIQSLLTRD